MAEFRISGIRKDSNGVITHYAVHTREKKENVYFIGKAIKYTKEEAGELLLNTNNTAKTDLWNYYKRRWEAGADIHVTDGQPLFLKTNPDSTERDNLLHLIDMGYIF